MSVADVYAGPVFNGVAGDQAEALLIQMLGGFAVSVGSRPIDQSAWPLRKTRNLLKLLALTPSRRVHREHIIDVLWPEQDAEAAANNLHKSLYLARRILEPTLPRNGYSAYLHLQRDFVALALPAGSWIDVDEFQRAAQTARLQQEPLAYEEALYLYTGDLLPEDRSEDWVVGPREELRALYCTLWMELAVLQEQRGAIDAAIHALRQAVGADPVHEEANLHLMGLLVRSGQRHLALRRYQRLREALRKDLDAEPGPQVQALYEQLLRGTVPVEPFPTPATHAAAVVHQSRRRDGPSLVGRDRELQAFQERLNRLLAGHGGLLLLRGEPGVGKSRLAAEWREEAERQGAAVLRGTGDEHETHLPFSLFCTMLEDFARRMDRVGGDTLLSDDTSKLARLLRAGPALPDADQQALVTAAMADFFNSLTLKAPVLVVLDDLHAADPSSLQLLRALAAMAPFMPLLILATIQPEATGGASSAKHVDPTFLHVGPADQIDLQRLGFPASTQLIDALLGGPAESRVFERVFALAHGNPHYTEEAVHALRGRGQLREVDGQWRLQIDTLVLPGSTYLRRRGRR